MAYPRLRTKLESGAQLVWQSSASAACAISGSAWLSPAATTTLQCVEGKKSLRPYPFTAGVFTSAVCITTAEDKQAREKSYDSVQRALRNPFVQGKAHHHAQPLKPTRWLQYEEKQYEETN